MKKIISMIVLGCFAVSLYWGAAAGDAFQKPDTVELSADAPGWQRYVDEPVTLDWYVNYSWFVADWGEDLVSRTITEETGVDIRFITPMGNEEQKLNALISMDALPDIITLGWWEPQVSEMIAKGMVYPLNELADQYDAYFYEVSNDTIVNWYTNEDGNIYCYPCSALTPEDVEEHDNIASNQTFLVRKDIYEAIGSPDMTTPDGFAQAVRDAAEMFPEVDGEPLIPIGAHVFDETGCVSFDKYLQNFLAVPWMVDGEVYDRNTDPEYITWLKMFRQLGEEGYLADDIFVDQRSQMCEKVEQGRYFCMLYQHTDLADQEKLRYQRDPDSIYIAVDGPKNSSGDDPVLPVMGINGWTVTLISRNCQYPERAIALMDYMLSEHGQKLISIGVEGVTYDVVDGQVVLKEEVAQLLNSDREKYNSIYGADDTYWMLQDNAMQLHWTPRPIEPMRQLEEWTYPYAAYTGEYDNLILENTEEGIAYNKIQELWGEILPQLLLADTEEAFDELLAQYVAERDQLGYEQVREAQKRQIEENKQILGIE